MEPKEKSDHSVSIFLIIAILAILAIPTIDVIELMELRKHNSRMETIQKEYNDKSIEVRKDLIQKRFSPNEN